jgi:uncharacterized protein (DUF1501 family)
MTHHAQSHDSSRRRLLKASTLGFGGAVAAGALGNLLLPAGRAHAADYKALVCIFLYGGNDGMNMVVPTDATRYPQYSGVRGKVALPQAKLLPLAGSDFGLHPSMAALQTAWNEKRLAPLFNVGPLQSPLTKAQYQAAPPNSATVPSNLFSHADQQTLWQTGTATPLTRTGWGGRAAETLVTANPVISTGANGRFGVSSSAMPLVIPGPGGSFGAIELAPDSWRLTQPQALSRANTLRTMYRQTQTSQLGTAFAKIGDNAFDASARLGGIIKTLPGDSNANAAINAGFAPLIANGTISTPLGAQLYQIAKLVAARDTVQGDRQIFYAELGGFDTHSGQVYSDTTTGPHADLLKQVAGALAAFDAAMKNLGLADAVTSFTQSDFGRTFKPNTQSGTDHAWGNHQLVVGGAVKGGLTYGTYPELVLGGADDVASSGSEMQGRWIPTTSVDQYAATLLGWFGANDGQLNTILPNLPNFGANRRLAFL